MNCTAQFIKVAQVKDKNSFLGNQDLSEKVLFGNEIIELHESMFDVIKHHWLCFECRELGYCKKEKLKAE